MLYYVNSALEHYLGLIYLNSTLHCSTTNIFTQILTLARQIRTQTLKSCSRLRQIMCGCCIEHLLGYFRCRVIKLLACLCQVGTSAHLITDKWGFVPASVRINPFYKHSYPNLLNMPLANQQGTSKYCSFPQIFSTLLKCATE